MDFEVIIFDTAPTGHTLRFLNFPNILEKGLSKLLTLKEKFNSIMQSMGSVFGSKEELDKTLDSIFGKMEKMK
jgi:arsenite/tail-anchored protein-transporting ATPase